MTKKSAAKKLSRKGPLRPLRSEAEYDIALAEIERYFDIEQKPGAPAANRFDLNSRSSSRIMKTSVGRSNRRNRSRRSVGE